MSAGILLTGATGYIGGRLLRQLEEGGRAIRCLVREPARLRTNAPTTETVQGDCLDETSLDGALAGVDSAYYLVHSMSGGSDFADVDRRAADNFGRAARRAGVRRIIYLGGLTGDAPSLSTHLKSRVETGDVLRASGVPVVEFRASIVIGAGSLSFQMIEALVERLPVMICPRWVATSTQPIAIEDVLAYLVAALDLPGSGSQIFEIGGPEVVSYGDMMREYARLRGLRRLLLPVPLLTPHLSGLWLALVTPAQARVGRALVEGLRNSTVVRSTTAHDVFHIQPMRLRDALNGAIHEAARNRLKVDTRTTIVDAPPAQAFAPIRRIGGATGWYFGTWLWSARGRIDRLVGGVGMSRGRRDAEQCGVGDVIDGWTVEACEPERMLRLSADLTLPGRGWLEFEVMPLDGGRRSTIRQTATFDPRGVLGRAYWYAVLPIHGLLFRGMLRRIAERAEAGDRPSGVSLFMHRSVVDASADDLFRWHERPEALLDLSPQRRWVRLEDRSGGLHDGGRVTFSMGVGPLRMVWEARHFGYVRGRQFCDEQVRGPFRMWRHTHRFEPIGANQTLYEDRVEYAVRGGRFMERLTAKPLRRLLTALFAQRHAIVRARVVGALCLLLTCASAAFPQEQPASKPVATVESVDLDRYAGEWFEIARFPNRFQRSCTGDVRASYSRRPDGRLDVINRCRTADGATKEAPGVARVVDTETSAKLKVRFAPAALSFLPFVWGDYWILGLAGDYSWAVVGSPDREYLWILSRTPAMQVGQFEAALSAARANGFDVERLNRTAQSP